MPKIMDDEAADGAKRAIEALVGNSALLKASKVSVVFKKINLFEPWEER